MAPKPLAFDVPRNLTDRANWDTAVAAVRSEVRLLSADELARLAELAADVHSCKTALHAIVAAVNVGAVCAECGGECCRTGKYHFTVIDLLVYLFKEKELFTPCFDQQSCPYLGESCCLMSPGFRPFTCLIFNCERVDDLLGETEKEELRCLEKKLRYIYDRVEGLVGGRFTGGLLMNCEHDLVRDRSTILKNNRKPTGGFDGRD